MDLKDNKQANIKKFMNSFSFAFQGILLVIKDEQNMRFHLVMSIIVFIFAFALSIPKFEILILLILIGIVMSLEMINTAIERTVDLVTPDFHPLAKQAKDAAAGAVLIFSIITVIVGLLIFLQPLLTIIFPN
jgi:undecaprenol kinase